MSFYGRITEADPPLKTRRFFYLDAKGNQSSVIGVHDVYFYESGHVGFWKDLEDNERELVLAVKTAEVWEEAE